jgi:tRNA(Ile)-lysidine synthase
MARDALDNPIRSAVQRVPAGAWAVGVSGGADSVALLRLLHAREDLSLHVVHLDHETRGAESAADAEFVALLAQRLGVACSVAQRHRIEQDLPHLPANASARYRAARMATFRQVVERHGLQGVLLAHHADDQAETILHRLLRGRGPAALGGMTRRSVVGGLTILRPLLAVRRASLRAHLKAIGQDWREDASNMSTTYLRNHLRIVLARHRWLHNDLLAIGRASRQLRAWIDAHVPVLAERFPVSQVQDLPHLLAREALRRWLVGCGAPPDEVRPAVLDRLHQMIEDAAAPAKQHFPGRLLVTRRRGTIAVEPATRQ